jgi:membrane fusion protein (multidrug efflux system)
VITDRSQNAPCLRRPAVSSSLVLLAGTLLLASGCRDEEVAVSEMLPSVSVHVVEPKSFDEEIHASGDLEARFHTTVAAEVDGRVTELAIDEGGRVEAGAVVIEIDPERRKLDVAAAEARLAQARANLRNARSQTRRIRELRSQSVTSIQALEDAETELALAEAAVRAEEAAVGVARRALAESSVSAPFAGLVARRSVQLGEFVQKGTDLYEIVALDPLEAVFSLTELDTERVRIGQTIAISVGAFPDRRFSGVVSFVSPTIDPMTRTLRIKAQVDNADGLLRPGLFARVSLGVARRENVLMVPAESLLQRADGVSVYRVLGDEVSEGQVERVAVETGTQLGAMVEVRGGALRAGDRVVRRGHGGLADGMTVVVVDGQQAAVATADTALAGESDS